MVPCDGCITTEMPDNLCARRSNPAQRLGCPRHRQLARSQKVDVGRGTRTQPS